MKTIKHIALLATLFLALGSFAFGQSALTQTTLSNAVGGGQACSASGLSGSNVDTTVTLGSGTNVNVSRSGAQPRTILYVDQEAMGVLENPSGTQFTVLRGTNGTKAGCHAAGSMVLVGNISPQTSGGFSGSGGLQVSDPPPNGACTAANTGQTPWVNMITGAQWLCSTVTATWVAGWNNPLIKEVTTLVASAAGAIVPSGPLFHINGTQAITGFTIPVGFNATAVGGGSFCAIPDAVFTTTTAGNIALASTGVVNKLLCWSWDATNSKFVPTY